MYSANDDSLTEIEREQVEEQWRREVASRFDRYRGRRKKKAAPQTSLSFDFEQTEQSAASQSRVAKAVAERFQSSDDLTCDTNYYRRLNAEAVSAVPLAEEAASAPAPPGSHSVETAPAETSSMAITSASATPEYDSDFDFDRPRDFAAETSRDANKTPSAWRPGNLIHFPKSAIRLPVEPPTVQPRPREELAEPVSNPPRILDVPEGIIPTIRGPLFAEIRLDADSPQAVDAPAPPPIELPLQVAFLSQRVFAALIDGLIVLAASAIFCAAVWKTLPELPHGKPAIAALIAIPIFFWTVYHYLLLVYGGKTAGMEMANISLRSFNGRVPTWKQRKHRVYSMLFSLVSMGLGFAWALVDEDCLCWHDRMTRTFLTSAKS
jgi:uncharacterized RDD family membrane protein YckC